MQPEDRSVPQQNNVESPQFITPTPVVSSKKTLFGLLILLGLVIVIVGGYFFVRQKSSPTNSSSITQFSLLSPTPAPQAGEKDLSGTTHVIATIPTTLNTKYNS